MPHRTSALFLALAAPLVRGETPASATGWAVDAALKARTTADVTVKHAPRFSLNLDLPAAERWDDIAAVYKVHGRTQQSVGHDRLAFEGCVTVPMSGRGGKGCGCTVGCAL